MGNVDKHVYGTNEIAIGIEQRGRVGPKMTPSPIGAFSYSFYAPDGASLAYGNGHWALVMREELAVHREQLPGDAPPILAGNRDASGESYTSGIEIRDQAVSIRDVYRRRKFIYRLKVIFSLPRRGNSDFQYFISHLGIHMHRWLYLTTKIFKGLNNWGILPPYAISRFS
jgi:hypothetical protein